MQVQTTANSHSGGHGGAVVRHGPDVSTINEPGPVSGAVNLVIYEAWCCYLTTAHSMEGFNQEAMRHVIPRIYSIAQLNNFLHMLIVGLTGGIACGKSTVSAHLSEKGCPIVDADVIAREVVEPGKPAYNQVVAAFLAHVPNLLNTDGTLNRAELGKAVFGNPDRLRVLNGAVHAAVKKEMAWQLITLYLQGHRLAILDVPLLFEARLDLICGATVSVAASYDVQIERLRKRNPDLSLEDAEKRIASQLSNDERNRRADIVLSNDGTVEALQAQVDEVKAALEPSWFWTYFMMPKSLGNY